MAKTVAKSHLPGAVIFDSAFILRFAPITLSASMANGTVQAETAVPANVKILAIAAVLSGSPAGTVSVNVAAGSAAEGGAVSGTDTLAVSGNTVLAADEALTVTADLNQVFQSTNSDAVWPTTLPLNVRVVTNASGAGTLQVSVLAVTVDLNQTKPLYNSSGTLQV